MPDKSLKQKFHPLDFSSLKTVSLFERSAKVSIKDFGKTWNIKGSFSDFLSILPSILAGEYLREAVSRVVKAVADGKTVILGMGAHPIKVGLTPIIIQAIDAGIFSLIATNGASLIHDVEIAMSGKTSEDVAAHLANGSFGAVKETAEFIHEAIREGYARHRERGLGWSVGKKIYEDGLPFRDYSLFASLYKSGLSATVHVAIGTDIIHFHPLMDPEKLGALTFYDFRIFCRAVSTLSDGVYINLGSSVIMPEVFLKALSVSRNLGHNVKNYTTINMDFSVQYRPLKNVVERPAETGGKGYNLTGHHEIMFPLFLCALLDRLNDNLSREE